MLFSGLRPKKGARTDNRVKTQSRLSQMTAPVAGVARTLPIGGGGVAWRLTDGMLAHD
jgi:hypothetical protein